MTREEAKAALPIIQAFAEGKTIQWHDVDAGHWEDIEATINEKTLRERPHHYRIKPQPRELWLAPIRPGIWREAEAGELHQIHVREVI